MATRVVVVFDDLPVVAKGLHTAAAKLVRTAAINVEARAKIEATKSVLTGANRAAIYTVTSKESGYAGAAANAESLKPHAEMQSEEPRPKKDTTAIVHAGMNYAVYLENGTVHMPAQPFMAPAAAAEAPNLRAALRRLASEMSA